MKFLISVIFCFLLSVSFSQTDSLLRILPQLKGEKRINTLFDISVAYSMSNPANSIKFANQALSESKKLGDQALVLQSYNILSVAHMSTSNFDSVINISQKAIQLATKLKNNVALGKAYNKIAMVNMERGRHKESIDYNFKALKIFEAENIVPYQGLILLNIGVSYEKLGLFDDALANYKKVLAIAEKTNSNEMFANANGNIGIIFMKKGKHSEADAYFQKTLKYIDLIREKKKLSILYQNLGVNARSSGNSSKGLEYYKKSLILSRETGDVLGSGFNYNNLANCYMDIGDKSISKLYIDSGFTIGKKTASLTLLKNSYRAFSRLETLKGNYTLADSYFEQYEQYRDSILTIDKVKAVSEIQTKYNLQAKEKQILQEKAVSEENKKRFYATGGLALSLALILFLVWQRQKLRLRKKEVETLNRLTNERNRIARDLHDNLGAELTIVSSKLDTKIYKTEKETEKVELEQIAELTRNANVVLRETVWSIKAEKLTVLSLTEKIKEFYARLENENSFALNVTIEEEQKELTPLLALNLFRISQEALTNVLKYANASKVEIQISSRSLTIQDDGQGFNLHTIKKGYGLTNMESRAKEFNGTFSVSSSNKGTKISVAFES
jgi:signal transduction histidine kinase